LSRAQTRPFPVGMPVLLKMVRNSLPENNGMVKTVVGVEPGLLADMPSAFSLSLAAEPCGLLISRKTRRLSVDFGGILVSEQGVTTPSRQRIIKFGIWSMQDGNALGTLLWQDRMILDSPGRLHRKKAAFSVDLSTADSLNFTMESSEDATDVVGGWFAVLPE
jgi:hypothetical protein